MEQILEQLNGPVGIGVAVIAVVLVLVVIRKVMSLIFLVLAVGLGGWGAARHFGWDIPFVLPGGLAEMASSAISAGVQLEAVISDEPAMAAMEMAQPEAFGAPATRSMMAPGSPAQPVVTAASAAASVADGVRTAQIIYNAPTTMQLNMPIDLRLVVDASQMEDLEALLEGLPGDIRGGEADLTSQVSASLFGSGFDIRALKPVRQILSDERPSTWQWEVTPRSAGQHTLILEVFAHPGGGEAAAGVREFRDEITVEVTVISRALAFVQTAQPAVGFVAGGVSLVIGFFGFIRRRRRRS